MKRGSCPYLVTLSFFLIPLLVHVHAAASTPPPPAPVLFFSDIHRGPNSGNSDTTYSSTGGAYVTLYGNFLSNYTAITLNGSACLTVVEAPTTWLWYQKMVVKIGTGCSTGNWSITTAGGTYTGPTQDTTQEGFGSDFTVVSGHIYYVSTSGSDSNTGTYSSPWLTPHHAKDSMVDGDISYYMAGTYNTIDSDYGCGVLCLGGASASECPTAYPNVRAMLGYPGAIAQWGTNSTGGNDGLAVAGYCAGYYTIGEVSLYSGPGGGGAMNWSEITANHTWFRGVGNNVQCNANTSQESGCENDGGGGSPTNNSCGTCGYETNIVVIGNTIHDIAPTNQNNALEHAIYSSSWSVIEAYNLIYNTIGACRGIQIYNGSGNPPNKTDYQVHDNVIHDTGCDGIGMYDVDPSNPDGPLTFGGGINAYNNVVWNTGEAYGGTGASSSCMYWEDDNNTASAHGNFYNNTLFNCQMPSGGTTYAGIAQSQGSGTNTNLLAQNNIIYLLNSSVPYVLSANNSAPVYVYGTNNLAYGIGTVSSSNCVDCNGLTNWVQSNPLFTNTSVTGCPDSCPTVLTLSSSSSPAIGAGTASSPVPTYDITGLVRPSPPSIGAYEFTAGSGVSAPQAPTNLTATVN